MTTASPGATEHTPDGGPAVADADSPPTPAALLATYRALVLQQVVDDRLRAAVSQGLLERWPAATEPAAMVGIASALSATDFLFPGPRLGAALARGASLDLVLAHAFGSGADPQGGRVPAPAFVSRTLALGSSGYHNAAHLTHAAGVAWAAKIRGEQTLAMALFDDAEAEEGEFHNALNFAGVFKLPVLFVAIASAPGLADTTRRAVAYGLSAQVANGSDVFAVAGAARAAAARIRAGSGAEVLVLECNGSGVALFEADATTRVGAAALADVRERVAAEVDEALRSAEASSPATRDFFGDVYATAPWNLTEQRAAQRDTGRLKDHG